MKYLPFLLSLTFITCSKQDADCDLTGTWRQVVSIPDEPEILSTTMELSKNGDMKFAGITGYRWKVKEGCSIFEYWGKADKSVTVEMKILVFDGEYLSLELLGGAFSDPQLDPFGFLGAVKFKKVN